VNWQDGFINNKRMLHFEIRNFFPDAKLINKIDPKFINQSDMYISQFTSVLFAEKSFNFKLKRIYIINKTIRSSDRSYNL